jgi:hypothetical protein
MAKGLSGARSDVIQVDLRMRWNALMFLAALGEVSHRGSFKGARLHWNEVA